MAAWIPGRNEVAFFSNVEDVFQPPGYRSRRRKESVIAEDVPYELVLMSEINWRAYDGSVCWEFRQLGSSEVKGDYEVRLESGNFGRRTCFKRLPSKVASCQANLPRGFAFRHRLAVIIIMNCDLHGSPVWLNFRDLSSVRISTALGRPRADFVGHKAHKSQLIAL